MHNYRVTVEVAALMSAYEAFFGYILTSGKLTDLDREILEYYSAELQKHLQISEDPQGIIPEANPSKDPVPSLPTRTTSIPCNTP
jgi:hypothetical protein